jgi:hypothetical protein
MSRVFRLLLASTAAIIIAVASVVVAQAADDSSVDIEANLTSEGLFNVTTVITLAEPLGPQEITFDIPKRMDRDGMRYTYTISDTSVEGFITSEGGSLEQVGEASMGFQENSAKMWASVVAPGADTIRITYTVEGATMVSADANMEFVWPLIASMNIDIAQVSARVSVPPGATNYDCQAGVPGALRTCSTYSAGTHESKDMQITNNPTNQGEVVQVEVAYPAGAIAVTEQSAPIWNLGRALSPGLKQIGLVALVMALGGLVLYLMHRRMHDAGFRGKPQTIASFETDEAGHTVFVTDQSSRPGMIGTLIDSSVDPIDILASILDLAVRGHLRITELETNRYSPADWSFTRLKGDDDLKGYEMELLAALTSSSNADNNVSELSASIGPAIDSVQDSLYQQMLDSSWFSRLPSQKSWLTPFSWVALACALVATGVLMAFTTYGLVGLALVALACILWAIAQQAHPIARDGAAVFAGLKKLTEDLKSYPADGIDPSDVCDQVSMILPYALVLGGSERWLDIMADADEDQEPDSDVLDWYHAPSDWQLKYFPASLESFITSVTGRLYTRI